MDKPLPLSLVPNEIMWRLLMDPFMNLNIRRDFLYLGAKDSRISLLRRPALRRDFSFSRIFRISQIKQGSLIKLPTKLLHESHFPVKYWVIKSLRRRNSCSPSPVANRTCSSAAREQNWAQGGLQVIIFLIMTDLEVGKDRWIDQGLTNDRHFPSPALFTGC